MDGTLVENKFKLLEGTSKPIESGFYTIKDTEGTIIEAGYQDLSITNDELYYVIALPKNIDYNTMVEVQTWDPYDEIWLKSELALTADSDIISSICDEIGLDISSIDTTKYTIWALEDSCTGSIIRYTIKEVI
jgi:hypothetical protein